MQALRDHIEQRLGLTGASVSMREIVAAFAEEPGFVRFENGLFHGHHKTFFTRYISKSDSLSSDGILGSGGGENFMYTRLSENAKEALRMIPSDVNTHHLVTPYQVFDFMIDYMTESQLTFIGI
jgi:hypothetical protein